MQFKTLSLFAAVAAAQDLQSVLSGASQLSTLTSVLNTVPQVLSTLGSARNVTILAPSNDAFSRFLSQPGAAALANNSAAITAVLQYHVLNGVVRSNQITNTSSFVPTLLTNKAYTNVTNGQVVNAKVVNGNATFFTGLLNNATVSQADVNFTGGVVHIIDHVLTIPPDVLTTALAANLTSLYGAVNATNLVNVVNYTPDVTIFAPRNQAFQAIGSVLANASTNDLVNVLGYHVVNGTVGYSSKLTNGQKIRAANGAELTISIANGNVFVNNARVITPDVLVANGVVHVIDNVLNPSNTTGPASSATAGQVAFASASAGSNAPFASGVPSASTVLAGATPTSSSSAARSSSPSAGLAVPMQTAAAQYGALLGVGAAVFFGL